MHVCMYICMYVCMCEWMYVCMHARVHACMRVCMYVRTYMCVYVLVFSTKNPDSLELSECRPGSQCTSGGIQIIWYNDSPGSHTHLKEHARALPKRHQLSGSAFACLFVSCASGCLGCHMLLSRIMIFVPICSWHIILLSLFPGVHWLPGFPGVHWLPGVCINSLFCFPGVHLLPGLLYNCWCSCIQS